MTGANECTTSGRDHWGAFLKLPLAVHSHFLCQSIIAPRLSSFQIDFHLKTTQSGNSFSTTNKFENEIDS